MEQHGRHWTGARGSWEMAGVAVSSRRPFVGRDREIDELRSGVDEAAGGRGGLFLIVGAAGMGKTRLADEAARVAEGRGARVLWGRCWETGGAPAYWPWLQILRELTRGAEGAALREALGGEAGPLAQLVPEAAAPPAARDAPPGRRRRCGGSRDRSVSTVPGGGGRPARLQRADAARADLR